MHGSRKRLDSLLDAIYDAATEPGLWSQVLTEIADCTGSQGGILFGQSVRAGKVHFDYNGRLDEACNRAYQARHVQNPWSLGMLSQPVGRIVLSDELVPLAAIRGTLFYDEVLRPQDVAHNAMASLAETGELIAAFNVCRSARQGPLSTDGRRFLEQLMPHLRRALQLGFRIEGYGALQRAEYAVLDRLSSGVILLDRRMRVLYANAAATQLGSNGGPLRFRDTTVTTQSPLHAKRLAQLFRMALLGTPVGVLTMPRAEGGGLLTLLITQVRGRDVGRFADLSMPNAAILLLVVDLANRPGIPLAWVVDGFGLTPAEARVALAAASGLTISEAAHQIGVSPNTVKTHLRKIFVKTGTTRQAELALLLASMGQLRPDAATRSQP